jgi:hypothetical protein
MIGTGSTIDQRLAALSCVMREVKFAPDPNAVQRSMRDQQCAWITLVARFAELRVAHIRFEERDPFARAQELLTPDPLSE